MKKIFLILIFLPVISIGQIWQKMPANYFLFPKYVKFSDSIRILNGIYTNSILFDTLPVVTAERTGKVAWDTNENTLSVNLSNDVSGQLFQEQYVYVTNKTGSTLFDGRVVYINGAQGNRPTAQLAQADSIETSSIIGVCTQNIDNNESGYVTVYGKVHGYNTTGHTAGAQLYLSAANPGWLTDTAPSHPHNVVLVATALNSTANGIIEVHPKNTNFSRYITFKKLKFNSVKSEIN